MDLFFWIVIGIVLSIFFILCTILALVIYAGLLYDINVRVGEPPVREFVGFYKFGTGAYKNASSIFTEACSIAPNLDTFGAYYDDPKIIEETKLRWISGSVIPKNVINDNSLETIKSMLQENGFKMFEFPAVGSVVRAEFPLKTDLSIIIGVYRVYPKLTSFVKENKLKAFPYLEFNSGGFTHFFAPLERHFEFYVPEVDPKINNCYQDSINSKSHSD